MPVALVREAEEDAAEKDVREREEGDAAVAGCSTAKISATKMYVNERFQRSSF